MSVLIKGMEKPKSCTWWDGRCPLLGDDDDCKLQDCQEEWTWQDQYKGCPLSDAPDTNVDTISRQAAIDAINNAFDRETLLTGFVRSIAVRAIRDMPSAQSEPSQVARDIADIIENEMDMRVIARSEITDEQAIEHLQASGWMQNHDKEMYESGLRAQLADDSDSYDALLESAQPEQDAEFWRKRAEEYMNQCIALTADMVKGVKFDSVCFNNNGLVFKREQPEQRWVPCSGTIDIPHHEVLCCDRYGEELIGWLSYVDDQWLCESDGEMMYDPVAWREKPEPYRKKRCEG